jgi:hypothetical protein
MIIIWDNGRDYSDHGLYFLEIDDLPEEQVTEALRTVHEEGEIIGTAKRISWRDKHATCRLPAFLTPGIFFDAWHDLDFEREMRTGPAPKREDALFTSVEERGPERKLYWYLYPKTLEHLTPTIFKYLLPMWRKAEWIDRWSKQVDLLEQYFKEKA